MKDKPKIALVLGGGSAFGFAHIGIIDVLLQNDIVPDIITGTSMGAVIGAAYASGLTVPEMIVASEKMKPVKFIDTNIIPTGMFKGKNISKILKDYYKDQLIEDCKIKFACVAVNLEKGDKEIFMSGNLLDAVRSSMNIPFLFVPYKIGQNTYIDGGMVDNMPAGTARDMGADIVISVDVLSLNYPQKVPKTMIDLGANIILLSSRVSQYKGEEISDYVIRVKQPNIGLFTYSKDGVNLSVNYGRTECEKCIDEIKEIINNFSNKETQS